APAARYAIRYNGSAKIPRDAGTYTVSVEAELPASREGALAGETDISGWAKEDEAMLAAGILNGKGSGNFDPQGKATRAEVATMVRNHMELAAR
ncbi:MAG: S-layer homology domain-containing protein, partial [Clostridiales bacterium]|nr:S-layer homology domain-containing protein [Clostridiales bacterium]